MIVVVTGATGLVGTALVRELRDRSDTVIALSRDAEAARTKLGPGIEVVAAELETPGPWCEQLAADAASPGSAGARSGAERREVVIVHLAGEPVAGTRWDARQKQKIRDSRVESTRVIVEAIAKLAPNKRPLALICASGIDYYPFAIEELGDDEPVTEADPPSDSFLARVCRDWEREAQQATALGVRVACMRTGLVLGGKAIGKLTTPFKLFVGGRIGSGEQWVSWIGLADAAGVYAEAVHDTRYTGPINLVTESVRNREFAKTLGKVLGRPSWLPVPKFAVRVAVGKEFADSITRGRCVVPAKLRELGYQWRQPELADALSAALAS